MLTYPAGAAAPANPAIAAEFAPDCTLGTLTGLGAVIVGADQSALGCPGQDWTNGGPMTWNFATAADGTYSSKIFFDQIGAGFGGHFWFAYTINNDGSSDLSPTANSTDPEREITGTWPAPSSVSGWNEILVHIPSYGAWAVDANYQIDPGGGGAIEHRVIDQAKQANTWVNLGIFHLGSGASVSLSNVTWSGGGRDIAWNDVAFVPTTLLGSYVAMGDSYSSGEGVLPYNPDSDYSYDGMVHSCHRSPQSYPYDVTWGGHALPIASEAENPDSGETFADTACTGIETNAMSWDYPVVGDPSGGSEADCPVPDGAACNESIWEQNGNVDWGGGSLNWGAPIGTPPSMGPINIGELPQTDQGWLDSQTALVTLTIGGNDARFSDIVAACAETDTIVSFDGNGYSSSNYYLTRTTGKVDPLPLYQMEPLVIDREEAHLEGVLDIIAQQAPNALILVLGYPRPFPGDLSAGPCSADALVDFIAPDTEFLNHMADLLDQTISQAVTNANSASGGGRIHYLDTNAAFETHRLCDSSYPDLNGIVNEETSGSGTSAPGVDTFHPTLQGQEALAGVVNAFLAGN